MKQYMVNFAERMQTIEQSLARSASSDAATEEVQEAEALLEELQDIVESIDCARDLTSIGACLAWASGVDNIS
jgi:hypothetical protein